jgi:hypothetical protein
LPFWHKELWHPQQLTPVFLECGLPAYTVLPGG